MTKTCSIHMFKSKRFAGHSKWQNIKHQKEENDASRAALFLQLRKKIKAAVIEGGSVKPTTNVKLARILEQCKKVNMPVASVNAFLEKLAASKGRDQSALIEIAGPRNCLMVIKLMSDNIIQAKINLNCTLKKINAKITDGLLSNAFNHNGIVIVEKKNELEKAMEDAINIGAIDIEEIEDDDNKCYKFKCEPQLLPKIVTQLKNLDYHIITTKEEVIPFSTMKLSNEDLEIIKSIQEKLLKMDEVHEIYDNIDRGTS
ncbi:hypothetical protein KPH14_003652 [Odynerus spinipes]|uniref:Uncharacterized protein n=1 Tax=Odynerus spinipes TaxID=1348599 RepID=A0AAD9VID1_9HYME|nr:hypothetical protein KPH14_003652 [Odynerus spinipes]